jgi:hypothetical protein
MRRRVLLPLLDVLPAPVLPDDLLHCHLEVTCDERVGMLVDRQACGRVRHVHEHGRSARARRGVANLGGDVEQLSVTLCGDPQLVHGPVS